MYLGECVNTGAGCYSVVTVFVKYSNYPQSFYSEIIQNKTKQTPNFKNGEYLISLQKYEALMSKNFTKSLDNCDAN